jgi:hypothetical protein
MGRNGRGQPEIVCRRHGINQQAGLVAASYGIDDSAMIWDGRFAGQAVSAGVVVESAIHPSQFADFDKTTQSRINS